VSFFGRHSARKQKQQRIESARQDAETDAGANKGDGEEDEEMQMGLRDGPPPPRTASSGAEQATPVAAPFPFSFTPVRVQHTPDQGSHYQNATAKDQSPTAMLAAFFKERGDAPISEIERQGIMSLLNQAVSPASAATVQQQPSQQSVATPGRQAYTPIFSPAPILAETSGTPASTRRSLMGSSLGNRRRPPSFTSALAQSPFKRRSSLARTGFLAPSAQTQRSGDEPMALLPPSEGNGKRGLEEVEAPLAKRTKLDAPVQHMTGRQTAASMLAILDEAGPGPASTQDDGIRQQKEIKAMLNPYARSAAAPSPRRLRLTPAKSQRELSALDVMRGTPSTAQDAEPAFGADGAFIAKKNVAPAIGASLFSPAARRAHGAEGADAKADLLSKPSTKVHSQAPGFSFQASQQGGSSEALQASFATTASAATEHEKHGGFSFMPPAGKSKPKRNGYGLVEDAEAEEVHMTDANESEHAQHGGFQAVRTTEAQSVAPAFSTGADKSDKAEHNAHGGFVFNAVPTSAQAKNEAEPVSSPANIHKLRDGTEYASPTKKQPAPSTAFVFKPSIGAGSSTPAFTFGSANTAKQPSAAPAPAPTLSFTFDPSKKAEPLSTNTSAAKAQPKELPKDEKSRAAAVPVSQLQAFDFTLSAQTIEGSKALKDQAKAAELMTFKFTTTTTKSAPPATAPKATGGFDWAAAGMKAPNSAGWTCDVCMVSNPADKEKCLSCESDRPRNSANVAAAPALPKTNGGSFNWAAAGMKVPVMTGWTCDVCMVSNPADKDKCLSCETPK
jgi:hypothetical protein